jgi:hypothetical protein
MWDRLLSNSNGVVRFLLRLGIARRYGYVGIIIRVLNQHRRTRDEIVAYRIFSGRSKSDAQWFALPFGRLTRRCRLLCRLEPGNLLCQHRLAYRNLRNYGVEALNR